MDRTRDLTAEARIRRAALRLFAERGFDGTSVRAIAEAAGVSPALVIHHFGSKEALQQAVSDEVIQIVTDLIESHPADDRPIIEQFESPEEHFRAVFTARPEIGEYISRLFFEGSEAGVAIFRRFVELSRYLSSQFEERGLMRRAPDPEMRDIQLIVLEIAPLLFQRLFERYFNAPPLSEEIHRRWVRSEFDMFTRGLFAVEPPTRPLFANGEEAEEW